jgi:hypothetical protein
MTMKILIAPLVRTSRYDAAWLTARTLSDLFSARQHICAVSAPLSGTVASAALYDAPDLRKPKMYSGSCYSYEEWLYACGAGSKEYLLKDTECLLNAIDHFKPDLIIAIDRAAAVIAARVRSVPCAAVVNTAMYRSSPFPLRVLQGTNLVLSEYGFEQVFRIHELYGWCLSRIVFGPLQLQPLPMEADAKRTGTPSLLRAIPPKREGVCLYFSEISRKPAALKKTILETFLGAPFPVYACVRGIEPEKTQNVRFMKELQEDLIPGCAVCIHDGNEYLAEIAASDGIPQLIITNHRYGRIASGLAARRYGFGVLSDEADLSVASLYENYRRIVSDPDVFEAALRIRDEVISLGSFEDLCRYFTEITRK